MSRVRSGHLLFGVGLAVMGYALVVIAFAEQAQRVPAPIVDPDYRPQAWLEPAQGAAGSAPMAVTSIDASFAPASSAALGAPEVPAEGADVRQFKFSAGGAIMSRDEVQRLMSLGKLLARRPSIKVSIEAFGDRPGSDQVMVGIAKHRAKVSQMLLAKAGVSEDRVTSTVVEVGSDVRLARTIRVTLDPSLSEADKP